MNQFASFTSLAVASLYDWAEAIKAHRSSVFMLSTVVAALFSFLMWVAYRRIKTEKWMKYFSWSFGLLSLQYLLFLVDWFRNFHPAPPPPGQPNMAGSAGIILLVHLVSMVNNLCAVAAAQNIENKSPLVPRTARGLAVASVVTTLFIFFFPLQDPLTNILLSRGIASIFSAYCLFKVGFAIFANISIRRHRRMALGAVLVAGVYVLLQLAYGAGPLLAAMSLGELPFEEQLDRFDMLLVELALPLKFCLCGFAYLLVMRFLETLNEVRNLPKWDEELRQDYLSTNGVARLIASKLGDEHHATQAKVATDGALRGHSFVNIIVKLPGEVNKRVACIPWPNAEPERREFIWRKDDPDTHDDDIPYDGDLKSIAHVAIISHGAVVGCLQVARARYRFSPMALRQIREIANLLAPAVQAYRELASLDQMSIRFAWKQAEETRYSPAESTKVIAEIIHDIFAPHVSRLHMDFGFYSAEPHYVSEPYANVLFERMKEKCDGKKWEQIDTRVYADTSEYRLLKKQFTARVTETISTNAEHHGVKDRFITGNMILAVNDKDDEYRRAALGVTYLQRKTASTIVAEVALSAIAAALGREGVGVSALALTPRLDRREVPASVSKAVLVTSERALINIGEQTEQVCELLGAAVPLILCAPQPAPPDRKVLHSCGASTIITPQSWNVEDVCERVLGQLIADGDLTPNRCGVLRGATAKLRALYADIERLAPLAEPLLILGETGTGKDLVAQELHARSGRKGSPYMPINCPKIQPDLLGSELFGHEKGAFTGADRPRVGLIASAGSGTVFLDEIGDLDLQSQAKRKAAAYTDASGHVSPLILQESVRRPRAETTQNVVPFNPALDTWRDLQSRAQSVYFRALLSHTNGNRESAIKISGLSKSQFFEKIKDLPK